MTVTHTSNALHVSETVNDAMTELFSKLDEAIDDLEAGRVQPLEEAWKEIDKI